MTNRTVTLLACAPDGSLAAVRSVDGRIWLISSRQQREIQERDIDIAIAAGDLERVDTAFASWADVDAELHLRAQCWLERFPLRGVANYDVAVIEEILDDCDDEPGDYRKLALTLLRDAPAARDQRVFHRLIDLVADSRTATVQPLIPASPAQQRVNVELAA